MRVKDVLFIAPSAYTLSGLATWLDYLLPGLSDRGWRTTLGLVSAPRFHRPGDYLQRHPTGAAVEIFCATGTPVGRRDALRRVVRARQPDLLVTVNIPDAIVAAHELRREGTFPGRTVMTCHGIQHDLFADARLLSPALDAVVCTNRLAQKLMIDFSELAAERVHYAAYGTAAAWRQEDRPASQRFTIAYSGRIEEDQKRISDVAAIAGRLGAAGLDFRLLIAGSGPATGELRAALARVNALERTDFLGQVPADQLASRVYAVAHALLITSRWETGPIVAWESMAAGTPVVSARYVGSGLENALQHRENSLLFEIGDTQTAAALLLELAQDGALAERLAEGGRALVATRYSTQTSIAQWDEVLRQIRATPVRSADKLPITLAPHGRLDRWLGPRLAEFVRHWRGKSVAHAEAGGEWPHTLSRVDHFDPLFWSECARLDQRTMETLAAAPTRPVHPC